MEQKVAPHAGAWIETWTMAKSKSLQMSPPMRGRGLKQGDYENYLAGHAVAPHAGAWIETHL